MKIKYILVFLLISFEIFSGSQNLRQLGNSTYNNVTIIPEHPPEYEQSYWGLSALVGVTTNWGVMALIAAGRGIYAHRKNIKFFPDSVDSCDKCAIFSLGTVFGLLFGLIESRVSNNANLRPMSAQLGLNALYTLGVDGIVLTLGLCVKLWAWVTPQGQYVAL